jgi:hypothetical protein
MIVQATVARNALPPIEPSTPLPALTPPAPPAPPSPLTVPEIVRVIPFGKLPPISKAYADVVEADNVCPAGIVATKGAVPLQPCANAAVLKLTSVAVVNVTGNGASALDSIIC